MSPQAPIVTVTLNPAVDYSASVARVLPGPKLRLSAPVLEPGGGGVNVARAIHKLGGDAQAIIAARGPMGAKLLALVEAEGIKTLALTGDGETRHSLAVTDQSSGQQYRFTLPGPDWRPGEAEQAMSEIASAASGGGFVVLSGSQPPGVTDRFPLILAEALIEKDAKLVVDTSGPALATLVLRTGAGAAVHVLRLDQAEAEGLAGRTLPEAGDSLEFAERLVTAGVAETVVIARGANGNVLAGQGARLHCVPPPVPVKSKVGAGDSFTGAFVLSLARSGDVAGALCMGTAAGAAAVMTEATQLCRRDQTEELIPQCVLHSHFAGR